MSLGVLGLHVAASPGVICGWANEDVTQFKANRRRRRRPPTRFSRARRERDQEQGHPRQLGDEGLKKHVEREGRRHTLMTMPKAALVRAIVMNHWIHHRGQLSVYLRLLDVAVPSIYGPSADENPFAART
jgi:uncharacterized damage-inducible protein DinB